MIVWSIAAHIALLTTALLWGGPRVDEAPRIVMTVSLSGAPGPDTGGKTQVGDQAAPAPPPPEPVKPVQAPPAAKPPAMTLPSPSPAAAATTQGPARAGAAGCDGENGEYGAPREGPPRPRGQGLGTPGTGLSSSGGSGGAVSLDVTDFCCQEYLDQMADRDPAKLGSEPGARGLDDDAVRDLEERNDPDTAGGEIERLRRTRQRGTARAPVVQAASASRAVREPDSDSAPTIRLSAVIMRTHLMTWRLGAVVMAALAFVAAPAITAAVRQAQQPSDGRVRDQRRTRDTAAIRRS